MSDLIGNPEDRFFHNEAHIISDVEVFPISFDRMFYLGVGYDLTGGEST